MLSIPLLPPKIKAVSDESCWEASGDRVFTHRRGGHWYVADATTQSSNVETERLTKFLAGSKALAVAAVEALYSLENATMLGEIPEDAGTAAANLRAALIEMGYVETTK